MPDGGLTTALLVGSLVATAAGTGMAMYGANQQAQTATRMAEYNAAIQRQNADVQLALAQRQAHANARAAEAQHQAGVNNAITLRRQSGALEAQGRERANRMREEQKRFLAMQRGKFAAGGVTAEGSPLEVLSETARLSEMSIHDALYESEMERQKTLRAAELEEFQAGFSLLDADMQRFQSASASVGHRIAYRDAEMTRLAGAAQAQGYRRQGTASLISGATSMAGAGYRHVG